MARSFFHVLSLAAVCGSLSLSTLGCAAAGPDDATSSDEAAIASTKTPGIGVNVEVRRVLVGTPTYGYDGMAPAISVSVSVEDRVVASRYPSFNGFERPFALIPRAEGKGVRWERVQLAWSGRYPVGKPDYYGGYPKNVSMEDRYTMAFLRLSEADLAVARQQGVAVGMDTNVGTLWAQDPGGNFRVGSEGSAP